MRAHPEPIGYYTPPPRSPVVQPYIAPAVLFVVPEGDRALYMGEPYSRAYVHAAAEAMKLIVTTRPRVVVVDWDVPSLGGQEVCAAAAALPNTSVLVTTADVQAAARILKTGCHGILLKPFVANLLASRLARVIKETERPWGHKAASADWNSGTNRMWPETACPQCGVRGATSFDFSSYRRMWYACLSCEHAWLGPRQE